MNESSSEALPRIPLLSSSILKLRFRLSISTSREVVVFHQLNSHHCHPSPQTEPTLAPSGVYTVFILTIERTLLTAKQSTAP
jgi:hypothetical protein